MKNILLIIFVFSFNVFSDSYDIKTSCFFSHELKKEKLNLAIFNEVISYNAYHILYHEWLNGALIGNGHNISERGEFYRILNEIVLDQTGTIKEGVSESNIYSDTTIKNDNTEKINKSNIKRIGELLGIDAILFFAVWKNRNVTFRLVDCQTSELILSGTIYREDKYKSYKISDESFLFKTTRIICDMLDFATKGTKKVEGVITSDDNRKRRYKNKKSVIKERKEINFLYELIK